ncbi:alpha/beta hydrolase fold domain-containing protein [Ideonella sp. YS5]|uniref:alpha/beta hydrolase fold domain-containing protein n=1 Tax=Ideonella sp. YS5 TaxID=3453714 RepID=UPI003EEDE3D6
MRNFVSILAFSVLGLLSACGGGGGNGSQGVGAFFQSAVYQAAQVKTYSNVEYSRRPNANGEQYTSDSRKAQEVGTDELTLTMNVWVPPNATGATPMPLVVFIHGGGYNGGDKDDDYIVGDAVSYARSGFVTASINYRLTPDNTTSAERRQAAIVQGAEDAMDAIRYLKKNASTYHIDASRVAIVGTSAGGGLALAIAVEADTLGGTAPYPPYAGISSKVQAVVTTGATLIDQYADNSGLLTYEAGDAPVLLFHANPTDSETGATWSGNVLPTCAAINGGGGSCTPVAQANMTHTASMNLFDKWWGTIQPFLWTKLLLANV